VRLLGVAALLTATAAPAQIIETATITNFYSFGFDQPGDSIDVATSKTLRVGNVNAGGDVSELGMDLVSSLNGGDFYFLHNLYCVGTCSVRSYTQISFTLQNVGTEAANLRFDSLITPGHLAQTGVDGQSVGNFSFQVRQFNEHGNMNELYYAAGSTSYGVPDIETADGKLFSGYDLQGVEEAWQALDWSASGLNVLLDPIAAGQTNTLVYTSLVTIEHYATCSDLANCSGIQVAFGDPRTTGSIGGRASGPSAFSGAGEPIIGRAFDSFASYVSFVDVTDPANPPLPARETPDPLPSVNYTSSFSSPPPLPEPASWAMMIAGFAAIGGNLRQRRYRAA